MLTRSTRPLFEIFAAQFAKRLRDHDPQTTPSPGWLEERLTRQGASNVTVRNIVNSMRLIFDIDWAEMFESVSLVDWRLQGASAPGG